MNLKRRIPTLAIAALFMVAGILFCLYPIQALSVRFVELLLRRPLNEAFWSNRILENAILLICMSLSTVLIFIWSSEDCQNLYIKNKDKNDRIVCLVISIFFFLLFTLPFIIFGQNSVITIHDNLDGSIPQFHYIYKNHLFWDFDKKVPILDNISTIYLNRECFYLYNFIFCFLPDYVSYVTNYILCAALGFFSMFYFQKILFKNGNVILITLTSLAYAFLPVVCVYKMSVATLPFAPILFYKLITTKEKKWLFFSFIYPFVSEFTSVGLFVCGFWLLGLIAVTTKQRKFYIRLLFGFLLICLGFLIAISRLLYMRFLIHEPLNRDFFTIATVPFIKSFGTFFFSGYYHAATLQNRLLDWVVFAVSGVILIKSIQNKKSKKSNCKIILAVCLFVSFFCALVASLSEAGIINKIVAVIFPPLAGVSFTRIYTIARVTWYIAFTASLLYITSNKKFEGWAYALGVLQILIVFIGNKWPLDPYYADSEPSWRKNLIGSEDITWREFYSEKQFKEIKEAINYDGENVCALGYHPGVLLYNDFNTIDGYISVFPREQQLRWHELLQPEFDRNEKDMRYFDSWGGRLYIYNKDLKYAPTREKYHKAVDLFINIDMLKNYYKCKYILSRAELSNSAKLGLIHKGTFSSPESIYVIWVYEVE